MATIEEFIKTATKEQKRLLIDIGRAKEQEQKFAGEVNRIYDSIKLGIYSPDDLGLTVCKDLDSVRYQMKDYMIKAVELGMGELGIIKRNYKNCVGTISKK